MEKSWLQSYPNGISPIINPDSYSSIVAMFEESCALYSQLPAFYNFGVTLSYHQLDIYSRNVAAYLQNVLQLKQGDRIALLLPNILQYPVVLFAALRAGLIVVNVNPLYTARELVYQLKDAGAETIVVLDHFAHTVQKALSSLSIKNIIITEIGDLFPAPKAFILKLILKYIQRKIPPWKIPGVISFKKMFAQGKKLTLQKVTVVSTDIAFLQYTGGTTGVSKGAILSHRNMIANTLQEDMWFSPVRELGKDIFIAALPLYHIFSLNVNCLLSVKMGALSVLITNPRDIPQLIADMAKFKFTAIMGVNTLYKALLKNVKFSKIDFSRIKICLGGGAAIQKNVSDEWQAKARVPILAAYGLTEASPSVIVNPPLLKIFNGTVGLPLPSTEIDIFDEKGNSCPAGQAGELAVKGPQVMSGYWQNPEETKKLFTKTGWLLTGDIASINDKGFVQILERKKDIILVSGFNVYPNEIEDILVTIPGISEAAVISIPDENTGEAVKAFIIKSDTNLTKEAILAFCRANLTGYKIPKQIEFVEQLPKSNIGKILRRELRNKTSSAI